MQVEVHARRVELPDETKEAASKKAQRLNRYLTGMERAEIVFSDGQLGRLRDPVACEVLVEGHGHVIRVAAVGSSPAVALDLALDKAGIRLTRLKKKLVDRSRPRHAHSNGNGVKAAARIDEEEA